MAVKKKKSLAVRKKNDLQWAGANSLLGQPKSDKEATERKVIVLVAKALSISPFGVNILGSLPYINNKGLKEKLAEYQQDAQFEYEWVQFAKDDTEKAICKARVVDRSFRTGPEVLPLCGWVIGECSPATTRMGTLKGYQNHLAQTRAENRAMEAAIGTRLRKELFEGIAAILGRKETTPQIAEAAQRAANVTAEEMPPQGARATATNGEAYAKAVTAIAAEKNVQKLDEYRQRISRSSIYNADQKKQLDQFISDRIEYVEKQGAAG